jgi:hypothetical protein
MGCEVGHSIAALGRRMKKRLGWFNLRWDLGVGGHRVFPNRCPTLRAPDLSTVRRGLKTLYLRAKLLSMEEAVRSHGCFKFQVCSALMDARLPSIE